MYIGALIKQNDSIYSHIVYLELSILFFRHDIWIRMSPTETYSTQIKILRGYFSGHKVGSVAQQKMNCTEEHFNKLTACIIKNRLVP